MPKTSRAPESLTAVQLIALNRLKKSPRNARTIPHTADEIEALAASHKAHGLLQNPIVEPGLNRAGKPTGYFLVTAGEGRRKALLLRAKRGEIAKTYAVRCTVDAEHDPYEISLAENAIRTPMHPADQFDAFHELHSKKGLPAEDIAARFGLSPAIVKQRLKLASVSSALIAVYRAGAMSLEQLSAFTVTDDAALQERVWEDGGPRLSRREIIEALTEAQVPATDPRARFVGAEAYRAAGGAIIQDLFDVEGGGYFADAELLLRLAREKLESSAETLKTEGWKWIEAMPRLDHAVLADCRRIHTARKQLTDAEQERLEGLEAEYEALEFDGSDDSAKVIERIETEIAALEGEPLYNPEDIARAGAVLTIAHDGTLRIDRGFVRPEDVEETEKPARKKAGAPGALSEKLVTELTAFKTAALRDALAEHPETALTAVTHALALSVCFRGAAAMTCLEIGLRAPNLTAFLPDINETVPAQRIAARHEALTKALPEDPTALWDHLAAQSPEDRLALFAHCVAFAVDVVQRPGRSADGSNHPDQLARAVNLDLAAQWKPTAKNYLGRVSKDRVLEAVGEAVSKESAQSLAGLPKAAMAEAAEARLAQAIWLPALLRVAPAVTRAPVKAQRPRRSARPKSASRSPKR